MKRLYLLLAGALAASAAIPAKAERLEATDIRSHQSIAYGSHGAADIVKRYWLNPENRSDERQIIFIYDGRDLNVREYNRPHDNIFEPRSIYAETDGGVIKMSYDEDIMADHTCPDHRLFDLYYRFQDFPPGDYTVSLDWAERVPGTEFEYEEGGAAGPVRVKTSTRQLTLRAGQPAYCMLRAGEGSYLPTVREGVEWIYRNESSGELLRMRFDGRDYRSQSHEGPAMNRLYLYQSSRFDPETALLVAYMREGLAAEGDKGVVQIEYAGGPVISGLWADGNINRNTYFYGDDICSLRTAYDYSLGAPAFFFDYLNGVNEEMVPQQTSTVNLDGYDVRHIAFANGAEWLEGVGSTGSGYAANLPYPAYSLTRAFGNGEATPTTLLCLRDLTDGHIIYGTDPGADNESAEVAGIEAEAGSISLSCGTLRAKGSGRVSLRVFDTQGRLLAAADGEAEAELSIADTGHAVIIATVTDATGSRSYKLRP